MLKLMRQAGFISGFQQSRAELSMNLDRGANYLSSWITHGTRIIASNQRCPTRISSSSPETGKAFNRKDREAFAKFAKKCSWHFVFLGVLCANFAIFAVKGFRRRC